MLTFIAAEYQDDDAMYRELTSIFGAIQVETEPMSLREISKILILNARGSAAAESVSEAA